MNKLSTEKSSNFINTQFKLWYQPVYKNTNGDILHHEVLLRWFDQQGRIRLPYEFFPQVSRAEMLKWLDYLVIRKAIGLLAKQPNLCLSINVSREAVNDSNITIYIQSLLEKCQVEPHQLGFELTERDIANNFSNAFIFIRKLKTLGCSVTLDGFSNSMLTFSQWEKLPVDLIKVDGRLIQNLTTNQSSQNLVKRIVEVSQALGQVSIAKSVSYNIGPKVLQEIGILCGQGHYLKPPSAHISSASLVNVLDIFVDNISSADLLAELKDGTVFTPNVDHLMKLKRDPEFLDVYSNADYKVCDSQVLLYASKFLGTPIKEKISGSDFFPDFYNYHKKNQDIKIFLLGGPEQQVASQAQLNINQKVGRKIVVNTYSPPFKFEDNEVENLKIIKMINQSTATVLAVGVGAPKQEKWITKHRDQLPNIKIFLAIGATINFEAGFVKRAPVWMSRLGVECVYRLLAEPKRLWKRYLVDDLPFLGLVLKQKLHGMGLPSRPILQEGRLSDMLLVARLKHRLHSVPFQFTPAGAEPEEPNKVESYQL